MHRRVVFPALFTLAALFLVVAGSASGLAAALRPRRDDDPAEGALTAGSGPGPQPWTRRPVTRAPARPRRRPQTRPTRLATLVRGRTRR